MDKMKKKQIYMRTKKIVTLFVILFSLLISRLFWIQIVKGASYRNVADKQHAREIRVAPARGNIFDRNNVQLTNSLTQKTLFIFKDVILNDSQSLELLKDKLYLSDEEIEIISRSNNKIIEIPLKEPISDDVYIKGVIIEDKILRYDNKNILSHVIGYLKKSENTGEYGIEKEYNDILKMNEKYGIKSVTVDGKQRIIPGLNDTLVISEKKTNTNSVKLTVDINMQNIVEKAMDEKNVKGAIIIVEVATGDILAIASRPNINQNDVETNFGSSEMDFYNKALEVSYPPGSIFKTVVLISALEKGLIGLDDVFFCKGYEDLSNFQIKCNNSDGHGEITAYDAFCQSCNSAFIQIGKLIGSKEIIQTAKRLGFGSKVQNILIEAEGNLPAHNELLGPAIGNISIGQSSIEVTPIQVSNMMMIIANDGLRKSISIVDSIVTEEGRLVKKVNRIEEERVFSEALCKDIKKCLEGVVNSGTAKNMNVSGIGGAAGKTGSAENIKEKTHAWFSGYFPTDKPKYVITVFIEEGGSGSKIAVPIFEKIVKSISNI
ncbi:MAG: penicillin-binding protein 2 [Gottschalkiaceae bacterium]|nr:MAG: penicillin-binding protein 2 [Gottschalkiaceae bacterium]